MYRSALLVTSIYHKDDTHYKANVEVLLEKPAGVAEHPDTLETIEKELKIIAEYDDELQMLDKYFIAKDPFKS